MPVMSHPTFLGSFIVNAESGIAPSVFFGQLPRLAGADISIYPTYGGDFPVTQEDCRQIASETAVPWGDLKPIFPTAAGRIDLARLQELIEIYQAEMVIVVGGALQRKGVKKKGSIYLVNKRFDPFLFQIILKYWIEHCAE